MALGVRRHIGPVARELGLASGLRARNRLARDLAARAPLAHAVLHIDHLPA
jgi:hypothetical protein